jgi:MarR family transcriptional regulator for hemolysin
MSLDIPGYDMDRNLGFVISDLQRLITTAMDSELKVLGLTRSQLRIILHLSRQDGLTQVRIAEDLEMGKVAIGGLLDRLESKQLVQRKPHPTDRRATHIFLTPRAHTLYKPIVESGTYVMGKMLTGISNKDQNLLIDLLLTVKRNTQKLIASTTDTTLPMQKKSLTPGR